MRVCTIANRINFTPKCARLSENENSAMKFDRSNKFDLCYYGQVNSLRLKSTVDSKWQVNTFGSTIYSAGDGSWVEPKDKPRTDRF